MTLTLLTCADPINLINLIELVEIIAYDLKSGNAPGGILDPDSRQVATMTEQKRPDEDVRGLVVLDGNHLLEKNSEVSLSPMSTFDNE